MTPRGQLVREEGAIALFSNVVTGRFEVRDGKIEWELEEGCMHA